VRSVPPVHDVVATIAYPNLAKVLAVNLVQAESPNHAPSLPHALDWIPSCPQLREFRELAVLTDESPDAMGPAAINQRAVRSMWMAMSTGSWTGRRGRGSVGRVGWRSMAMSGSV